VGFAPLIYLLVKDGILTKTGRNSGFSTDGVFTSEEYALTTNGNELLAKWKQSSMIE
jgi:hypothetical protein